jgi:uncharacterized protein (TIGR03083 family)
MTNRASVPDTPAPASPTPATPPPATPAPAAPAPATDRARTVADRARTVDQLGVAIEQLVRVVSNVRNPNAPATDRWTVTDVAAHVAGNLEVCTAMVRGVPSPAGSIDAIGALNDLVIATLGERDIDRLAQHIEAHAAAYIEAISSLDGDPLVPWHAHLHLPASTLAGLSLGETIVHGLDIARATDQAWPVPADWARTVIGAALPVLPHYLKPDRVAARRMRYEIRFRGAEALSAHLLIADGRLTVTDGATSGDKVDCHVSAEPWTFVRVMYGRSGLGAPLATGKIIAWGRRPWLGLRLPRYFRAP